ncbi:hypothetical protein KRM28CT15_40280 [Krasilnikovia sp. M28-CT-15]
MNRCHWFELPLAIQSAVREHTGDLESVEPVAAGSFAELAVVLRTATPAVFCKAVQVDNPRPWMLRKHWVHLRTSNPIESTFATVRHRTRVTKGPGGRAAGLAMRSS